MCVRKHAHFCVSIPSRGFWFFEVVIDAYQSVDGCVYVSIPSWGFWFFEAGYPPLLNLTAQLSLSIPSRGFWFFEEDANELG